MLVLNPRSCGCDGRQSNHWTRDSCFCCCCSIQPWPPGYLSDRHIVNVSFSLRQPSIDSHAGAGTPETWPFKTCQVLGSFPNPPQPPPQQLAQTCPPPIVSANLHPLTLSLLARMPSHQCHFIFSWRKVMIHESRHWMGIGIVKSLKGGLRVLVQSLFVSIT